MRKVFHVPKVLQRAMLIMWSMFIAILGLPFTIGPAISRTTFTVFEISGPRPWQTTAARLPSKTIEALCANITAFTNMTITRLGSLSRRGCSPFALRC